MRLPSLSFAWALSGLLGLAGFAGLATTACSSSSTADPTPGPPEGSTGDGGTGTDSGKTDEKPSTAFKTYVILGDSISDRGGEGPFFYDLVEQDLNTKLGGVTVVKNSRAGAQSSELPEQVSKLPAELAGPVAVSVTIGGNDMQAAALQILQGKDQEQRAAFAANLGKAYDELTRDGRFGAGVKVTIFHANIYDPSDGEGNFADAKCPAPIGLLPKQPTNGFWDNWNKAGADATAKYGKSVVAVDIRTPFQGHGIGHFEDGTSYFARDCIHPNKAGHGELRKLFAGAIAPSPSP